MTIFDMDAVEPKLPVKYWLGFELLLAKVNPVESLTGDPTAVKSAIFDEAELVIVELEITALLKSTFITCASTAIAGEVVNVE